MSEEGKTVPPAGAPVPADRAGAPPPSAGVGDGSVEGRSPSTQPPALVSIEEFKKFSFRVGVITAAQDHPNADRLLVLTVDLGDGAPPRQVVAGIKGSYAAPDVIGKQVVVVANLKPATLRGVESQGMVLAASEESAIVLIGPERPIRVGSPVK